jgi:hypothetical protein
MRVLSRDEHERSLLTLAIRWAFEEVVGIRSERSGHVVHHERGSETEGAEPGEGQRLAHGRDDLRENVPGDRHHPV